MSNTSGKITISELVEKINAYKVVYEATLEDEKFMKEYLKLTLLAIHKDLIDVVNRDMTAYQ